MNSEQLKKGNELTALIDKERANIVKLEVAQIYNENEDLKPFSHAHVEAYHNNTENVMVSRNDLRAFIIIALISAKSRLLDHYNELKRL